MVAQFTRLITKRKAVLMVAVAAVLLSSYVLMSDSADQTSAEFSNGDLTYEVSSGEAMVTGLSYEGQYKNSIIIPSSIFSDAEYPVTSIDDYAFYNCSSLTSVTIPDSVTSVGDYAFKGCTSLTSVTMSNNIENISVGMFFDCSSLTSVTIPDSVGYIGNYAFSGCSSLTSITIPSNVNTLGYYIFTGCTSLTTVDVDSSNDYFTSDNDIVYSKDSKLIFCLVSKTGPVIIPEGVTSIRDGAFSGCTSLTSVTIPSGVNSIGSYAFRSCTSLTSVTIPSSVTSIGNYAFYGCSSLSSVEIPNDVTTISMGAFEGCSSLTSVTIPEKVTSIGYGAFSGCTSLTSVTIPGNVETLENSAFEGCHNISSLTLNEGLKSIGYYAFSNCLSLTSVTIPGSVNEISPWTFYGCINLTDIEVSESIYYYSVDEILYKKGTTSGDDTLILCPAGKSGVINVISGVSGIGDSAFEGCGFVTSVVMPEGVKVIGDYAFFRCGSLTSVDMPSTLESIGYYAFSDDTRLVSADLPVGLTYLDYGAFYNTALTSIVIPGTVSEIYSDTFSGCSWLTSVTISEGVTVIGDYAFSDCSYITSITLPEGITNIGSEAFAYCESLSSINIPSSVISIGSEAFVGTALTSVNIPEGVTEIGEGALAGCSELTSISVGSGNAIYESESGILYENRISEDLEGSHEKILIQCPAGKTGEVTIMSGTTSVGDYAFAGCTFITAVTIPLGVENIGDYAFSGCSAIDSLIMPEGVISVGYYAFSDCTSLTSVHLSSTIVNIDSSVIEGCTSLMDITVAEGNGICKDIDGVLYSPNGSDLVLCPSARTSVTIPEGVERISDSAFVNCTKLVSVSIPNSVREIGYSAFMNCEKLESVEMPDGLTSISSWAFQGCSSLESITIPEGVVSIGQNAFAGCTSLAQVNIPEGVNTISSGAFQGCNSLSQVTIPENVTYIGDYAFMNCWSLTQIDISSVVYLGNSAFSDCERLQQADMPIARYIGDQAFRGCNSLTQVSLSSTVTFVGPGAFSECYSLSGISVSTANTNYSGSESTGYALYSKDMTTLLQCPGRAESITIPSTVRHIENGAFDGCWDLAEINVDSGNSAFVSYDGVLYSREGVLMKCPPGKEGAVTVHEGTVAIGNGAFSECYGITSVSMPLSVVRIEDQAFYLCISMTSADIPSGVKRIGEMAFYGCLSLETATIPAGVTVIEKDSFTACISLEALTISPGVMYIGENAFAFCMGLQTVNVPGTVVQIDDYAFGHCISLSYVVLNEGTAVIGEYAFAVCGNLNSESVVIPSTAENGYVSDTAFSATWDVDIFVVFYDSNGGTGSSIPSFSFYGEEIDLPSWEGYSNPGKVFGGWSETGFAPAIEGSYVPTGDVTLKVIWNDPVPAIVTFDSNEGTGTVDPISDKSTGDIITLPSGEGLTKSGFEFIGWSATVNGDLLDSTYLILGDVTLYAVWNPVFSGPYTVTWDVDGDQYTQELNAGEEPVYSGPTPEKASTAQYTYSFIGWDKPLDPVTGDVTYTAVFQSVLRQYEITWNVEGILTVIYLDYGEGPVYSGTPTKASTLEFDFTFSEWTPSIASVTGDTTYTAVFDSTTRSYNVTWIVEGESTVIPYPYGTEPVFSDPSKESDEQYWYEFKGWSPAIHTVEDNVTYTAVFEPTLQVYDYDYNLNGGEGVTPLGRSGDYGSIVDLAPGDGLTKTGHTFGGWSLISDGAAITEPYALTEEVTFYAVWEPNTYWITWVIGELSLGETYDYGVMPTYPGIAAKPSDAQYEYEFIGWTPAVGIVTEDKTYTAQFDEIQRTYFYGYDLNEGDGTVPSGSSNFYGYEIPLAGSEGLTKTGHTFDGWSETADGDPVTEPYYLTGNVTLYAVWTALKYTLYFDANGAEGPVHMGIEQDFNSIVTLPGVGDMSKEGYTFGGWSETKEGTAVTLPYRMPLDGGTLYAIWNLPSQATIAFDTNGGMGSVQNVEQGTGTLLDLPDGSMLTKAGYTFEGWSEYLNGSVLSSYVITGDAILYAVWDANPYIVIFDVNGAMGTSPPDIEADYGSVVTMPEVGDLIRSGFTFGGWSEASDGIAVTLPYLMPLDGKILYAVWNFNQYTVTFNANGATGEVPESITENYGSIITLPGAGDLTKTGHDFSGWSKTADGPLVKQPYNIPLYGEVLYAVWTVKEYTLTFDANGAAGIPPSPITADYDLDVLVPSAEGLEMTGYTFGGWSETEEGTAVALPYRMPLGGGTLYAVWEINSYTVTFDANGATGTVADITDDYNSIVTLPGVGDMSKEGYTFGGWSETEEGTAVALPYRMPLGGDILYAIWIPPSPATLTFDLNGGTGTVSQINGYTGTTVALPSGSGATRQGYTFLGWSAYADGEILPTSYTITGNATIYAVWSVNKYTLDFLTNGATGTPHTIYADYNSEVTLPGVGDMSKEGHTFGGWETLEGDVVTSPYFMPLEGGYLYAIWNINQYEITWNWTTEAGPQTITEHLDYGTTPTKTVSVYKTATEVFTFSEWSPEVESVSADVTYTAQYTSAPRQYNVTWNVDGTETTTAFAVGAVISLPDTPTKTGYSFTGWSPAVPATMPAEDIGITATWTINQYTITFDANGGMGSVPAAITADYDSTVSLPGAGSLAKTGYIFNGWSEAVEGEVIPGTYTMPFDGKMLYASWILDECTLTFDANGGAGTVPSPITKNYGLEVDLPSLVNLSKTGHTFGGWSLTADGTAIESPYTLDGNVTLYAVWDVNKYTLSFDANGATGTIPSSPHDYDSVVTLPTVGSLVKIGHSFGGWSVTADGEVITETYRMPLGDTTLYAVWTVNQYTITFDSAGGSAVASINKDYGTEVTPPTAPTKTGYTFSAWTPALPATMPAEDISVTATWDVNQYTITFVSDGSAVEAMTLDYGAAIIAPEDPTKTGYTFSAWTPALPATMPAEDISVTATWDVNQYTITFDSAGGSAVASINKDYGTEVTPPTAPTKTGYTFAGWSPALPNTILAENITVIAQWNVNQYTITFVSDGSAVAPIIQDYGSSVTVPTAPTKMGYSFTAWSPAVPATMPAEDIEITATWTINQYTITFDANGGTGSVPAAITADYNSTVSLPEVGSLVKAGYTFGGWSHHTSGSTLLTPYTVTAVDETLYAVWNIITYSELPSSTEISDIISQDDEPVLQVTGNATDEVLDNTTFQSLGNKPLTVDVVDDEGQVQYSWTFEGDYKSEAGTFKAGISEVTPEGDLSGAISSTGAKNPLVLNFAASGELPINATLKYYVGTKYADGTKLTLFFYNETTKQLEEKAKDLVVTGGWVTLSLTHCSSYVLAEPAPEPAPEGGMMLYIGLGVAAAAILAAAGFFILRRR